MANYDNKLGEWYKQLEKKVQEQKAKKNPSELKEEPKQSAVTESQPIAAQVESPAMETPVSTIATIDTSEIVVKQADIPDSYSQEQAASGTSLFSEENAPQVEDFFSFLNRSREPEASPLDMTDTRRFGDRTRRVEPEPAVEETIIEELSVEPVEDLPQAAPLHQLSEGTGVPRPIGSQSAPVVENRMPAVEQPQIQPAPQPRVEARPVEPVRTEPKPAPAAQVVERKETPAPTPAAHDDSLQEKWDRMPHHLQVLFGTADEEIAQNSYKPFRETRGQLVERLLDPTISLEETARILNVCPTTVRRYTNRGVLPHYRTAGNQRRFRLSDILSFMEHGARGPKASEQESQAAS